MAIVLIICIIAFVLIGIGVVVVIIIVKSKKKPAPVIANTVEDDIAALTNSTPAAPSDDEGTTGV